MRTIKKYKNRKFYCSTTHKYVSLKDLKTLFDTNEPILVLCAQTKQDITQYAKDSAEYFTKYPTGRF